MCLEKGVVDSILGDSGACRTDHTTPVVTL